MYTLTRQISQRELFYPAGTLIRKTTYVGGNEVDEYDGSGKLLAKETYTIANGGTLPSSGTNYNAPQYNQQPATTYYDKDGTTVLESVSTIYTQNSCEVNCSTVQTVTTTMNTGARRQRIKSPTLTYDCVK
ncbi:MAG TPA: hypothetical protein VKV17_23015 [Bryobacteraceae bacterium]|nr:hypothetical protein [Bryobacteraceae bacterium]